MTQTILTGLRTNADFHLGNYLGAMMPIIEMAKKHSDEYVINMFIPDLHSFTTPIDHDVFLAQTTKNIRTFFAAGLPIDKPAIHVYRQSRISAHSELAIILNNFVSYGALSRMVEFKEKKDRVKDEFVSVGLFDYPVLMASDILLYDAAYVPVGDDQRQHLELTRDIAERFNNRFGDVFVVPKTINEQAQFFGVKEPLRIMSLQNPEKKMSKSVDDPSGTILLFDTPDEARKKVMGAVTDSVGAIHFDKANQPGITNLLVLLSALTGVSQQQVNSEYEGRTEYGSLKKAVADAVADVLEPLQDNFMKVRDEDIEQKLSADELYAHDYSQNTLKKVQRAIGLRG